MPNAYFYSNVAVQTTLSGNISNSATSVSVASTVGWPTSFPFVVAIDFGAANEELVSVTNNVSNTLTVTRAFGGTSGVAHSSGAVVRHVFNAVDATDFRTHEAATGGVHGVVGDFVGTTATQTLSNKTLTSPTINSGALTGTFTGTPTFSGAVVLSGTPNISAGAALAGTFTGTPTFSGNVVFTGSPSFTTGTPTFSNQALAQRTFATGATWRTSVTGDANDRFYIEAGGQQNWGSGSAAVDTNLYRSAANTLKTDDALVVTGDLDVQATTWTTFTPTYTIGGNPAMSTNVGWHKKFGKIVFFEIYTVFGSDGIGTADIVANLPSTPFRDGAGAGTTRQTIHGNISGMNGLAGGASFARVLATGTGTNITVERYDFTSIQTNHIQTGTILMLQGWYREA